MEIPIQDIRQNHIVQEAGSIIPLQDGVESQNDDSIISSQEGTAFVTIANAVVSPESMAPVEATSSMSSTTFSSSAVTLPTVMQPPGQETTTVVIPPNLPEGCSLLIGEDNAQYVTVPQDGQTYAIPISEFQAMQQGRTLTFQGMDSQTIIMQAPNTALVQNTSVNEPNPQTLTDTTCEPSAGIQTLADTASESQLVKTVSVPNSHNPIKWGIAAGTQDHLRPSFTKAVPTPSPAAERKFKPIKVDNWGIFLLSRLQSYFQKKEFCDLTIRFPSRNAQIKVHRLMVNACTDFFLQLEQEAKNNPTTTDEPGVIDMPSDFTPETVAPIIKFMYTGRLEFKQGSFEKLRETASKLQMFVLTKLMDAQLNSPIINQNDPSLMKNGNKRKRKRNIGSNDDDPVKQMKKIKKIEKKFTDQEKKNRAIKMNNLSSQVKTEPGTLPGKKLPFWKKREFNVTTTTDPTSSQISKDLPSGQTPSLDSNHVVVNTSNNDLTNSPDATETNQGSKAVQSVAKPSKSEEQSKKDSEILEHTMEMPSNEATTKLLRSSQTSINDDAIPVTHSISSPTKAYGKEQPKGVPKKIREINEDLTFEKIRRTGTRKTVIQSAVGNEENGSTSGLKEEGMEEDMKEFIEEQKKRITQSGDPSINENDEDDDYFDNDAELGYDDYNEGEDQPNIDDQQNSKQESDGANLLVSPGRPILKSPAENASPTIQTAPRKSVRFSLRPGSIPVPKGIDSNEEIHSNKLASTSSPNKNASLRNSPQKSIRNTSPKGERPKRGGINVDSARNSKGGLKEQKDELDETVDEFTRAVEEEQELEDENDEEQIRNTSSENGPVQGLESSVEKANRKTHTRSLSNESKDSKRDVRKFLNPQPINIKVDGGNNKAQLKVDQKTDMVSEILRKFPNILKENKQVKIKVMAKDSDGKSRMQIITLKSQGAVNSESLTAATAARTVTKSDTELQKRGKESNIKLQFPSTNQSIDQKSSSLGSKPETVETPVAGNLLTGALGLRDIPKVKYTGKRGRPKKVQPGEIDPHADVRKKIEERLQKAAGIGQTLVIESTGFDRLENREQQHLMRKDGTQTVTLEESNNIAQRLNDPSSEAEALSHVASGIATSLGLAANASNDQTSTEQAMSNTSDRIVTTGLESRSGPLADLEHYEGGQSQLSSPGVVNYQIISETSSGNHLDSHSSSHLAKSHVKSASSQGNKNNASKEEQKASKFKEMEMDWEDEDDV